MIECSLRRVLQWFCIVHSTIIAIFLQACKASGSVDAFQEYDVAP